MAEERRMSQRTTIDFSLEDCLTLFENNTPVSIPVIHDTSPFGLGLEISTPLEPGTKVSIEYIDAKLDITVDGYIMWIHAIGDSNRSTFCSFKAGIRLDPANSELNLAFYEILLNYKMDKSA